MKFNIDFSKEKKDGEYEEVLDGVYVAECVNIERKTAKESGNEYIAFTFKSQNIPFNLTLRCTLQQGKRWMLRRAMMALSRDISILTSTNADFDEDKYMHEEANITIKKKDKFFEIIDIAPLDAGYQSQKNTMNLDAETKEKLDVDECEIPF